MSATESSLADALHEAIRSARAQHRAGAGPVLDILSRASPDPGSLHRRLAEHAGVAVAGDTFAPDFSQWSCEQARRHRCVVLKGEDGQIYAAAEDPWNEELFQQVARHLRFQPIAAAATRANMAVWLDETSGSLTTTRKDSQVAAEGPIVQFVDQAIAAGFRGGASDVHFECDRRGVSVKHRLDGVMVLYARMDDEVAAREVISRIKVLARLDITEQRLPQDGRFSTRIGDIDIDLRVSIMPSVHGEDAVLRLLDKAQLRGRDEAVTLDRLGFDSESARAIRALAQMPSGMLLVTGPTGSGKTTTVYAALSEINNGLEKIITIEDPVEYELHGVLQIPVNERKGLTFAKGLRSILRHDPDRILVGEIRDAETAAIAVQSALTGHLVYTTVHANSVADIVGRFRHFGLDMFGFMSALNGVVVQRLLRRLCPDCAGVGAPTGEEGAWLARSGRGDVAQTPRAMGCTECRGTGYKGRFVVAEIHRVNDTLRDHIAEGAAISLLKAQAKDQGVRSLQSQAIDHVIAGRTTLDEVRRVIGEQ